MIEVVTTREFDRWLRKLKDKQGRLRILARLDRLAHGHFGDVKPVGGGVLELRLAFGPGYRVYLATWRPARPAALRRGQVQPG